MSTVYSDCHRCLEAANALVNIKYRVKKALKDWCRNQIFRIEKAPIGCMVEEGFWRESLLVPEG